MNLRILLARRIGKRLEREARLYRRGLRDHLRHEIRRIRKLEIRSRGLRLYAAWSAAASKKVNWIQAENWHPAATTQDAPEIEAQSPAAA